MLGKYPLFTVKHCFILFLLFLRSIHYDLTEKDLMALFSSFGKVTKCELAYDNNTKRSKGYCFIEFSDPSGVDAALSMDGFDVAGRKVFFV
jgi:RNA recognition motif-containing protein